MQICNEKNIILQNYATSKHLEKRNKRLFHSKIDKREIKGTVDGAKLKDAFFLSFPEKKYS